MPARTSAMNPLIETITSPEPADRDRSIQDLLAGLSTAEVLRACRRAGGVPPGRRGTSTSGSGRRCSSTAIYRYRLQDSPDLPSRRRDPVRRVRRPDGAAVRAGDRRVPGGDRARRPERDDRQRPGPGLRADHLPDPGRPGPPVGPELQGEPLDVPGRPGRRAPDPDPPPAPGAGLRRRPVPDPDRADARSGSTCRTRPGPTSSSSGWTTPRGPGS